MVNAMSRITIIGLLTGLIVTACSSMHEQRPDLPSMDTLLAQLTEQNGRACIRSGSISGYAPLSDRMVSVSGRRGEHFLVTTLFSCPSLDFSMGVAFSGSFSEICGGSTRDQLLTGEESCPIKHIYKFLSRADAFATLEMAEARRKVMAHFPVQQ